MSAANPSEVVEQQPQGLIAMDQTVEEQGNSEVQSNNPMEEIDSEGDDAILLPAAATVAPSNTPVTGGSGQASPVMQSSSDSLGDEPQQSTNKEKASEESQDKSSVSSEKETKSSEAEEKLSSTSGPASIPANIKVSKEGKKEEKKGSGGKSKKKEDKSIEFILRALNSLRSPEEKLAALCKKYADLHEEHRVLQSSFKTQQRTMAVVMREKDQLQSEHTKAVMAKSKLESLCRELQKHNKTIKEDSIQRAREDDEKRKEISSKFQTTIGEIQTQMNENNERNSKLREENMELASQLKQFIQQYENREEQLEKLRKHRELEQQLADAKLAQACAQLKQEEEKNGKEKELLLLKLAESSKKSTLLEAQVKVFKERYDEFESLHSRSNETFQKYKTEMDKMTKRIKKLEKDGLQWKTKWEASNKALLEMVESKSKSEKETLTYVQKTKKLESLCRALQAELHNKKISAEQSQDPQPKSESPSAAAVPPNSPEASSSGQCSPDSTDGPASLAESEPYDISFNSNQSCQPSVPADCQPSSMSKEDQQISSSSSRDVDPQARAGNSSAEGMPSSIQAAATTNSEGMAVTVEQPAA